jgi:hypothetical protein
MPRPKRRAPSPVILDLLDDDIEFSPIPKPLRRRKPTDDVEMLSFDSPEACPRCPPVEVEEAEDFGSDYDDVPEWGNDEEMGDPRSDMGEGDSGCEMHFDTGMQRAA